jgi:hypothetical protein
MTTYHARVTDFNTWIEANTTASWADNAISSSHAITSSYTLDWENVQHVTKVFPNTHSYAFEVAKLAYNAATAPGIRNLLISMQATGDIANCHKNYLFTSDVFSPGASGSEGGLEALYTGWYVLKPLSATRRYGPTVYDLDYELEVSQSNPSTFDSQLFFRTRLVNNGPILMSPTQAHTGVLTFWFLSDGGPVDSNFSMSILADNKTLVDPTTEPAWPNAFVSIQDRKMEVSGSLGVLSGITGSLFGTSSWAVSASWAPPGTGTMSTSSTFPITASWAVTASYAISASYAFTASYAMTSSWAHTASHALLAVALTTDAPSANPSFAKDLLIRPNRTTYGDADDIKVYVTASVLTVFNEANHTITISSSAISITNNRAVADVGGLIGAFTNGNWYDLYVIYDAVNDVVSTTMVDSGANPKATNFRDNIWAITEPLGYAYGALVASLKDESGLLWRQWYEYGNQTRWTYRTTFPTANGLASGLTATHYLGQAPRFTSVRLKVNSINTALQNAGFSIGDEIREGAVTGRFGHDDENDGLAFGTTVTSTQLKFWTRTEATYALTAPLNNIVVYPTPAGSNVGVSRFDVFITCEV